MDKSKGYWNFITQEWNNIPDLSNDKVAMRYLPQTKTAYKEYQNWREGDLPIQQAVIGVSVSFIAGILGGKNDKDSFQIANHALKSMLDSGLLYKD